MANYKRENYNVAIGTTGYILDNTPLKPARVMQQARVFGNRFASGDQDYTDFSFWWYWAQTEWASGFKDEVSWKDDGKYYYSTNIDAFSEYGAIKLLKNIELKEDFSYLSPTIICGVSLTNPISSGTTYTFVGTADKSDAKPAVLALYEPTQVWNECTLDGMTIYQNYVNQLIGRNITLWILNQGTSSVTTGTVLTWGPPNNSSDQTAYINSTLSYGLQSANCGCVYGGDLYIAGKNHSNNYIAIVKTSIDLPTLNSDWSKVLSFSNTYGGIVDMAVYDGKIYYLISYSSSADLRVWDPATSSDASVFIFKGINFNPDYERAAGKLLIPFGDKLIITMPENEIWSWNGSEMTRIFKQDSFKATLGKESDVYLYKGGIISNNKIYWGNLVYDGSFFFNYLKNIDNDITKFYYPLFVDRNDQIYGLDTNDPSKLYVVSNTTYKGTAGKNFLVFNQIDKVSTIDKLFYTCTIIFKKLVSGQKIAIEYSVDDMANWTELGNVSYSVDGGSITTKTFYFPDNFIYKKLWIRAKLESGGSNTPTFQDSSIVYYPVPEYKQQWALRVRCFNNLVLLDGKTKEAKRAEELRNILKFYWKNKQIVEFQDVDFAETLLNGDLTATATTITVDSTDNFSEQGIIKIDNEKIKYTSKTANAFILTDITGRGYEGTVRTTHSDNAVCSNSHKVIIINYEEQTPVGAEAKIEEFLVTLQLMEV